MMSIAESLRAIEKELEENKDRDYIQVQGKIENRGYSPRSECMPVSTKDNTSRLSMIL